MANPLPPAVQHHMQEPPAHLHAPFWQGAQGDGPGLQYRSEDGPWFERLCFRLIMREGHIAQYFGSNGQPQFGIDFVSTRDGQFWCWQCKNIAAAPSLGTLGAWLGKFEHEALDREKIGNPSHFVIFCTSPIKDINASKEFLALRQRLHTERGIALELRGREALDDTLKAAPDIVAEMFGNHAVVAHCNIATWRPDMWWALGGEDPPGRLRAYHIARQQNKVWRDTAIENGAFAKLATSISDHAVTVVCGMSGAGKTFAVLAACEARAGWRSFYLHLPTEGADAAHTIAEGMLQRLSYPTLFVIDDVHSDFDKIETLIDKFKRGAGQRAWRVVCTARRAGEGEGGGEDADEERSDNHRFLDHTEEDGALLPLALNDAALCRFALSQRPDWAVVKAQGQTTISMIMASASEHQ